MADQVRNFDEQEDEEYDEKADDDFDPENAVADEEISSSSDDEVLAGHQKSAKKAQKRKAVVEEELDSGDEATILERKRKRRKNKDVEAEESGGEGGLIKTRAQRLAEKAEKKERRKAAVGEVTIDVDKLWAELSSMPVGRPMATLAAANKAVAVGGRQQKEAATVPPQLDDMITIKRRIEYAGEVTEADEQVPRNSIEAQRYFAENPEADPACKANDLDKRGLQRPLKRPSMFEPNPTATVKGVPPDKLRPHAPSRMDVLMAEKRVEEERRKKAEKMSTVQKSALDWRGFVQDHGIDEELSDYAKSKKGYLAREQFLARAHGAGEMARREARLKG